MKGNKVLIFTGGIIIVLLLLMFSNGKEDADGSVSTEVVEEVIEPLSAMDSLVLEFDEIISNRIDSAGTIGAALAVVYKGEILLLRTFGVKEKGSHDSVGIHSLFRLASVSKTMTGTLAGILSTEGILPLDSRVTSYLPGFRLKDSINTAELNIAHLLSHTSGLVPHAYDNLVEAGLSFGTIMDSLFRVNISAGPGRLYGYQNVVFSLYDTLSVLASGKPFSSLMKEKVFRPAGMKDALVGFPSDSRLKDIAMPHSGPGTGYKGLKFKNSYFNTNPAAGISASISDMAAYLLALSDRNSDFLSDSCASEIFSPRIITPLKRNYLRKWNSVESKEYGLGWRIIGTYGKKIAYHGGYVRGYQAEVAVCRDEGFGIAYLTNSPNGVSSGVIPLFLDMYFE